MRILRILLAVMLLVRVAIAVNALRYVSNVAHRAWNTGDVTLHGSLGLWPAHTLLFTVFVVSGVAAGIGLLARWRWATAVTCVSAVVAMIAGICVVPFVPATNIAVLVSGVAVIAVALITGRKSK